MEKEEVMSDKEKIKEVENALDGYKEAKHPLQPLFTNSVGITRFKENEIVRYLLDNNGISNHTKIDMNVLARLPFSREDREQFAQLIGYSLNGFSELQYVSDDTYEKAASQEVYPVQKEKVRKAGFDYEED